MAKAIAVIPIPANNQQGVRDELQRKLESAPLEHAAALLALWELLEAAHEKQLLETARGAIAASDTIISKLAEAAANPGAIKGLRNLILLGEVLGSLDPEALHSVVKVLPHALHETQAQAAGRKPPSLWRIFRRLSSSDARRALGLLAGFAEATGAAMQQPKSAGRS